MPFSLMFFSLFVATLSTQLCGVHAVFAEFLPSGIARRMSLADKSSGLHGGAVHTAYKLEPAAAPTPAPSKGFATIGHGYCDWHYVSAGKIGVAKCAAKCKAQSNCKVFTYGDSLGCRYSKCGSDPGPRQCPSDKQCPLAGKSSGLHGGAVHTAYKLGPAAAPTPAPTNKAPQKTQQEPEQKKDEGNAPSGESPQKAPQEPTPEKDEGTTPTVQDSEAVKYQPWPVKYHKWTGK